VENEHAKFKFLKKRFNLDLENRKNVHYERGETSPEYGKILKNDGTLIIKDFFNKEQITKISEKVKESFISLKNVSPGRDLSGLTDFNAVQYFKNCKRLDKSVLLKGQEFYKDITDNVQIKHPLLTIPDTLEIVTDSRILDIAYDYLGACPAISYIKIVRNFANDIPEFDTQYFHIDKHASKMFKVFIYLNDVKEGGGPHCFMKGSHTDMSKEKYWDMSTILPSQTTDDDAVNMFGKESFMKLYANIGDIIIEDTTGWHKAEKPKNKDRDVIIITYGIGKEYSYYDQTSFVKINKAQYNKINNKNILDFTDIADE
jgi:hypothetical protein